MDKKRVGIIVDVDVLQFIDKLAALARLERSAFINQHFAQMMPDEPQPEEPPKRSRKA